MFVPPNLLEEGRLGPYNWEYSRANSNSKALGLGLGLGIGLDPALKKVVDYNMGLQYLRTIKSEKLRTFG